MSDHIRRLSPLWLTVLCFFVSACSQNAPTRFYTLSYDPGVSSETSPTSAREGISIGVGPIEFPQYLERSDIVVRSSPNKLEVAGFDKWGGDLESDFARTFAENLSRMLETDRISIFPWGSTVPVDYQITLRITAFETDHNGNSVLDVRWTVLSAEKREVLLMARSGLREATGAGKLEDEPEVRYEAIASAMSANIKAFSQEVADSIKSLGQP